jgi:hypothetical protein
LWLLAVAAKIRNCASADKAAFKTDSNGSPKGHATLPQMAGYVTLVISFNWVVGIKEETSASRTSIIIEVDSIDS